MMSFGGQTSGSPIMASGTLRVLRTAEIIPSPIQLEASSGLEIRIWTKTCEMLAEMIGLLGRPFYSESFDFGKDLFFAEIAKMGDGLSKNKELRKMNNARGSKHGIYIMRTFFGLYQLLNQLKAEVKLNYRFD